MKNNLKTLIAVAAIAVFTATSCKKTAQLQETNSKEKGEGTLKKLLKFPDTVISITGQGNPVKSLINSNKKSYTELIKDSVWAGDTGHSLVIESDEQVALTNYSRYIFPGSLIQGNSISDLTYKPLSQYQNKVKPITVSVSAHAANVSGIINKPSLSATRSFLESIYSDSFSGKEIASFSFDMNQFTYYDEFKLAFGANIKVGSIFNASASVNKTKIEKKTGLIAKFVQRNFTLDMDLPEDGNLLDNSVDPSQLGPYSPVYVSSITYGRMGMIKVESDYNYSSLTRAFKAAFNAGIVSGGASIADSLKTIIDNSSIEIYDVGGEGESVAQSINGYDAFRQYIISGGNYTPQTPGFPLYYTLSYLSDNSIFRTRFLVNFPKN
ncbi:thiol-activated cytolysin family protein [Pedobacter sp. 22226]|uniref:thiol-activated cytolysin family protein n=1 Tax=Pedobacter sp. 22226 TaxID=3453894 RepID=UPI003F8256F0